MLESACPDSDILRAFAVGVLSEQRCESIAAHIEQCPVCLGQLENLDDCRDDLEEQLRDLHTIEPIKIGEPSATKPVKAVDHDPWVARFSARARQTSDRGDKWSLMPVAI